MRDYDRVISLALICIGVALLLYSLVSVASAHTISTLRFIAIDLIFFSWISYLSPRSNADLKQQAFSAGRFLALSLATLGTVVVSAYLIAGMPKKVGDNLILSVILIALPAALIVPVVAKSLHTKWSRTR